MEHSSHTGLLIFDDQYQTVCPEIHRLGKFFYCLRIHQSCSFDQKEPSSQLSNHLRRIFPVQFRRIQTCHLRCRNLQIHADGTDKPFRQTGLSCSITAHDRDVSMTGRAVTGVMVYSMHCVEDLLIHSRNLCKVCKQRFLLIIQLLRLCIIQDPHPALFRRLLPQNLFDGHRNRLFFSHVRRHFDRPVCSVFHGHDLCGILDCFL